MMLLPAPDLYLRFSAEVGNRSGRIDYVLRESLPITERLPIKDRCMR